MRIPYPGVRKDIRLVLSGQPDQQIFAEIARLGLADDVFFNDVSDDESIVQPLSGRARLSSSRPSMKASACRLWKPWLAEFL